MPTSRDKKVSVILPHLNPFKCFEEVSQALRGLDYPLECMLEWMHNSDSKDENDQYYTERSRYNEREKVTRFNSFNTQDTAPEGEHCRGYKTLYTLYKEATGKVDNDLEKEIKDLIDDDIEFESGLAPRKGLYQVQVKKYFEYRKIDPEPIKLPDLHLPADLMFETYLTHLFKSEDILYFSNDCFGGVGVTREQALENGAGIQFMNANPCNGDNGTQNVTDFKYLLVEIDEDSEGNPVSLEQQYGWLLASKLPIKTITFSGSKSLHALVLIEAESLVQYRDRVDEMRDYLIKIGLPVDRKTIDPSRYTRVAGGDRKGKLQELVAVNKGSKSYDHWIVDRFTYLEI